MSKRTPIFAERGHIAGPRRLGRAALALIATVVPATAQSFVAGTTPAQRPVHVPRIESVQRSADWMARATAGVTEPIPPSLKFLSDQGDWYTPFVRPGMPGPYDIRSLHGATAQTPSPASKR